MDAEASQTPGTKVPTKQMEENSALAQMLFVSVCLCNVICTVETNWQPGGEKGFVWGSEVEIASS